VNLSNPEDGSTPLSPDEVSDLIPSLSTKEELNEFERQNILVAYRWALDRKLLHRNDPTSEAYVRELHRRMFDETWKWAGGYRMTEKNIGIHPGQIRDALALLLGDLRYWLENGTYSADEISLRFHHRLVSIHPFPNGNGRHARLMADVLSSRQSNPVFTWGRGSLQQAGQIRAAYIRALQAADKQDIHPLLVFARS
jgi:Fic-DOC domain mobile mystery protein B